MSDFPDSIYSPRTMVNRAGVVYDEDKTKVIYAEDFNKDRDEIVAIENILGLNPEGTYTSVSDRLDYIEDNLGGNAFPVGSVFLSVVSTNPATLLGYGTWSQIAKGKALIGLDSDDADFDTVEKTGGAKTHTLTESEMPSHYHTVPGSLDGGSDAYPINNGSYSGPNTSRSYSSGTKGSGSAHNNVQPYFVVYVWKRTA